MFKFNLPNEYLDQFNQLKIKLLNRHLNYVHEGQLDVEKLLSDYAKLLTILSVGQPTEEIRNYRIALFISVLLNVSFVVALQLGTLVFVQ